MILTGKTQKNASLNTYLAKLLEIKQIKKQEEGDRETRPPFFVDWGENYDYTGHKNQRC